MDSIKRTWHWVRNFLFSSVNKEFLIFLFFLALSGSFWLLMALNETNEEEFLIPVHLVGIPRNAVITDDLQGTIAVTIRDKGYSLLAYRYGRRLRPVSFPFSSYANEKTGKGVIPISDAQKIIYQRLFNSSKITLAKPDKLEFYFNYGVSRILPVVFSGNIKTGESFYVARTRIWPNKIRVYANERTLDSLKYVSTEDVNIAHLIDTISRRVKLRYIAGVKMIPSTVRVTIYPDVLTEESMEVPITAVNMPKGKILRMFPSRVSVKFIVGASLFRSIKASDFKVIADYNDLSKHLSDKCNIYLRMSPYTVSKAHLNVNQVDYLIEQQ